MQTWVPQFQSKTSSQGGKGGTKALRGHAGSQTQRVRFRMQGPRCHQPCLLFPPRSTPTRDTASAALSPVSTMKSHCCTFFRNTSEPGAASGGACTVRAQVAPQPPSRVQGAAGTEWPRRPGTAPSHTGRSKGKLWNFRTPSKERTYRTEKRESCTSHPINSS